MRQLYGARDGNTTLLLHERHVHPGGLAGSDGERYMPSQEKWQPYAFSSGMPFMWDYPKGYSPHVTSVIIRGCLAEVIPSTSPPCVSSMEPDTGKQQPYAFSSGVYVRQLYGARDGSTTLLIHKRRYARRSLGSDLRNIIHCPWIVERSPYCAWIE